MDGFLFGNAGKGYRRHADADLVPERGERTYYIDINSSFERSGDPSKGRARVIQEPGSSRRKSPPPPRPAPPSQYSTRTESIRDSKSSLLFADHNDNGGQPPVRPLRRKHSKLRSKTDSGTQTTRDELLSRASSKTPIKQYYLGEDPFNGHRVSPPAPANGPISHFKENKQISPPEAADPHKTQIGRSQTMPRQPKAAPLVATQPIGQMSRLITVTVSDPAAKQHKSPAPPKTQAPAPPPSQVITSRACFIDTKLGTSL